MDEKKNNGKVAMDVFVLSAIRKLRVGAKTKSGKPAVGIHVVYSGFNEAFRKYYGIEAQTTVDELVKQKKVELRPGKGGPTIYLYGEGPTDKVDKALAAILS